MNKATTVKKTDATGHDFIEVQGAREHNLQNINVAIPRNALAVITGISGSGKSSLAFDTLYAEGQRRYMESFSAYARNFIGNVDRPAVDKITGLSPVISIEQKTTSRNPRSTVGTTTEIYDFLRLLYARAGEAFSYKSGKKMIRLSEEQILDVIFDAMAKKTLILLAPVVRGRKGHYRELFVQIRKKGYNRVRVDGEIMELTPKMQVDRFKLHDIEIVIDRFRVTSKDRKRIAASVKTALKQGQGSILALEQDGTVHRYSKYLMDPETGLAYDELAPNNFSFNSPYGACPACKGIGTVLQITEESVIPDKKYSVREGAIAPLGKYRDTWMHRTVSALLQNNGCNIDTPVSKIPEGVLRYLLYGEIAPPEGNAKGEAPVAPYGKFEGIIGFLKEYRNEDKIPSVKKWIEQFSMDQTCATCKGARLKKEALHVRIDGLNIAELSNRNMGALKIWFDDLGNRLTGKQKIIADEIAKEVKKRIGFLLDIGLGYLTLDRPMRTLSGGEAQRIRLATQIGSQLVNVLYILDEPSIGLHARDNSRLIASLKKLRDLGNSVIVVEHDRETMLEADYIVDMGPGAGLHGGRVVAAGPPAQFMKNNTSTTAYLMDRRQVGQTQKRRKGNGTQLLISGARGHNLKNIDVAIPLGTLTCITGVSGSGKSTLIHHTLFPLLSSFIYRIRKKTLPYRDVTGTSHIDKVIEVDQSPIGRTPRSNPATYTKLFGDIRDLYAKLPESKIRGYKPGRFSFNVKGGRCEVCRGAGLRVIEMDFLPDVHVPCEACKARRYNRETLEVRFKNKSILDVLNMTVEEAAVFFANQPAIAQKIRTLEEVGLGYLSLGQYATTLSGGEAQRVKLAAELSKKSTGKTLYILDEPTTGLHFQDIEHLLGILQKLVDKGNTALVIEHNMDVIKSADHIIDLGPEGGQEGGYIVAQGTPEKVARCNDGYTGRCLREALKTSQRAS